MADVLHQVDDYFCYSFSAMASPCQLLIDTPNRALASALTEIATREVRRIEAKFSRYRRDNLCYAFNNARGKRIAFDEECKRLLDFAQLCYQLSDGMFDITSGILRRVWTFDGSDRIPAQSQIDELLPLIGWPKVEFDERGLRMADGMEVDFGGIGKEYAVSRVCQLCAETAADISVLVNLGGDLQITRERPSGSPWRVGIESPQHPGRTEGLLEIHCGALATSGDSKRFLLKDGRRYSHILNPHTGWPVADAPASITVATSMCVQAGCLATLALLQGKHAEQFLQTQDVQYWCVRP